MELNGHLQVIFLLGVACLANGFFINPEDPACTNLVPNYELEKPSQSFDIPFFSDKWNEPDLQFLTTFSPSSRSGLNRRKRSLDNDRKENESSGQKNIDKKDYQQPFTPRLGKRSDLDLEDMLDEERFHELDMYGNELTSRLGRSEGSNTIQLKASPEGIIQVNPAFTPRLGRSEGPSLIQLNPGSTFTPRLGRSEKIPLFAASAFTPRLGRSEGQQKVYLNAGSAFTPRLGRADDQNTPTVVEVPQRFTPRVGRSEGQQKVYLKAGSAFTPRLGRANDHNTQQVLECQPKFQPRVGRSEGQQKFYLKAGNALTPILGRTDDQNTQQVLECQPKFQPRVGRSGGTNKISLPTENTDTPQAGKSKVVTWHPSNFLRLG